MNEPSAQHAQPHHLPDSGSLLSILADSLRAEHQRLELEQSATNIDSLAELGLHPILESGLFDAGFGVLRERPYPGRWMAETDATALQRLARDGKPPTNRQRERCDIVITPSPGQALLDDLAAQGPRIADDILAAGTLYSDPAHRIAEPKPTKRRRARSKAKPDVAPEEATASGTTPQQTIRADECYWLEVKLVGQFTVSRGIPAPNRAYGSELTGAIHADLQKLCEDPQILRGGLLLAVCTDDEKTAAHDIAIAYKRALQSPHLRDLTVRSPLGEGFPLADHIGNRWCQLVLIERGCA